MNRSYEYLANAEQCLKLAQSSSETDRRALVQMAADWRALADKVNAREANPQEQRKLALVAVLPKSPKPWTPPLRQKSPRRNASVQTLHLKSR
jgi:hypothetical protein